MRPIDQEAVASLAAELDARALPWAVPANSGANREETATARVLSALDRRITAACLTPRHLRLDSPEGTGLDGLLRAPGTADLPTEDLVSPRLLATRLAAGDRLRITDVCLLWPALRDWCARRGHPALTVARAHGTEVTLRLEASKERPAGPPAATGSGFAALMRQRSGRAEAPVHDGEGFGHPDPLAALVGDADAFLSDTWGRTTRLVRSAERPVATVPFGLDDIEFLIDHGLHPTLARPLLAGEPRDVPLSATDGTADPAELAKGLVAGTTIALNHMHWLLPQAAELCAALQRRLRQQTQANIYITPPNAQGLPVHSDPHDTLILQLVGAKQWFIEDPESGPAAFTMFPGDFLYLPAGTPHEARCDDSAAMHLTVGVRRRGAADLQVAAMKRMARHALAAARPGPEVPFLTDPREVLRHEADLIPTFAGLRAALLEVLAEQDRAFPATVPVSARGCVSEVLDGRNGTPVRTPLAAEIDGGRLSVDGRQLGLGAEALRVLEAGPDATAETASGTALLTALRVLRRTPLVAGIDPPYASADRT
ncbi:MAG: hypothetical protein HOY75_30625 [Streptomyces sp.]|nr:hypothetical protein [Streptomyces sp.]